MFYTALTPLLPAFRADLHLSEAHLGYLVGCYALGLIIFSLPSGFILARIGMKPATAAALAVMAVTTTTFGFSSSFEGLLLTRGLQGAFAALLATGAMAWLVEVSPPQRRGAAMGFAMAATVAGTLIGPVLGAAMATVGRQAICITTGVVTVSVAAVMCTIPGPPAHRRTRLAPTFVALARFPAATTMIVITMAGALAGTVVVLVPLRLDDAGYSAGAIGAVFFLVGCVKLIVSPRVGRATDRWGPRRPLLVVLVSLGAVLVVLVPFDQGPTTVALMFLLYPALNALLTATYAALVSITRDAALSSEGALAVGNLTWAAGELLGATGVGLSLQYATGSLALLVLAGCALVIAALIWLRPSVAMPT
jgi:predicted MFS family arabinose efflux permease